MAGNKKKWSQGICKLCVPREFGSGRRRDMSQDMLGGLYKWHDNQ